MKYVYISMRYTVIDNNQFRFVF